MKNMPENNFNISKRKKYIHGEPIRQFVATFHKKVETPV